MLNLDKMHTIKVIEKTDGHERESFISHDTFVKSFVNERWTNERRTQKQYTMFGYYHTKTTVKFDHKLGSVRTFVFPKSEEEARQNHLRYIASQKSFDLYEIEQGSENKFGKSKQISIDNKKIGIIFETNVLNGANYFKIKSVRDYEKGKTYRAERYFTKYIHLIREICGTAYTELNYV